MKQNAISTTINHAMRFVALLAIFGFISTASAATITASAATISEDFEGIGSFLSTGEGVTDFSVDSARFTGGVSGIANIPELYRSGNHAWMVMGGQTGTIQFGPDVTEVSFYANAFSGADGTSVLTAFDGANDIIETFTLDPADPFQKITIDGSIDRIEYVNNDSDINRMNSLDDFSVTIIPLPPALALFGTALLAIVGFSKKIKSA